MWSSIFISAVFGALGILMSVLGYKLFDLVETKIDFAEEIKKGNLAVALVVSSFLAGICYIIGRTVGG